MPPSEQFRDLDGVERRALAQIVAHAPQGDAVVDRGIVAHAADEDRIFAHALAWGHVPAVLTLVDEHHAGRLAQQLLRLLRSEEHTSELQSLMSNSYAVFCFTKKNT